MIPNSYILPNNHKNARAKKEQDINRSNTEGHSSNGAHRTIHGTVYVRPRDRKNRRTTSAASGSTGLKVFKVNASYDDFIIGNEVTYAASASKAQFTASYSAVNTIIAKPWTLREFGAGAATSSYGSSGSFTIANDTKTYTVGATTVLVEKIEPPYLPNGFVVAANIAGIQLSGSVSASLAASYPSWTGAAIEWLDINADGRHFTCGYNTLDICQLVGGVPTQRAVQVRSGPIYTP